MVRLPKTSSQEKLEDAEDSDDSIISLSSLTVTDERQAFHFFDLPLELRSKILRFVLVTDEVYCLDPQNYRAGSQRLNVFLTSRRMHEDAYRVFYGGHTFRIFPTHGRFFGAKTLPMIARIPTRYREALVSLELRLGIGWTAPPKSWTVHDPLGLEQMIRVRVLTIFVQCDPSLDVFSGFRVSRNFYSEFSQQLLEDILRRLPAVSMVVIDTWPSVPNDGHLMKTLLRVITRAGLTVRLANGMDSFRNKHESHQLPCHVLPYVDVGIIVR